jgi:hypothetical protein
VATTDRYLVHPAAANGISRASSGGAAWSYSAYTELVAASAITADFEIVGLIGVGPTPVPAADTTYEALFDLASGAASSEVLVCQFPMVFRFDSAAGQFLPMQVILPNPKSIPANTRLSLRVAQSLATTSMTYTGLKLIYKRA